MGNYKIVPLDKMIIQGMMIEQKMAALQEDVVPETVSLPKIYSLGLNEELFFSSPREIVSYYLDEMGIVPTISRFEFIGEMDYMKNVVKEETTDGLINYYSYIDKDNYCVFSLNAAISSKIGQWIHINGNITPLYVELQKRGADMDFGTSSLKLVNNKMNNI